MGELKVAIKDQRPPILGYRADPHDLHIKYTKESIED